MTSADYPCEPGALFDPDQCGGCSRLEEADAPTVVLLNGQTVCTWCPAWQRETHHRQVEAYAVLAMADRPTRLAHLASREAQFGAEYRRRLEAVVLSTWEARRAAAAPANPEP